MRPWFQSHAGSIEALNERPNQGRNVPFQSHAGSIEAHVNLVYGLEEFECFNPTLVRLRPPCSAFLFVIQLGFQSHAGSIEAGSGFSSPGHGPTFQSHAGSIEASSSSSPFRAKKAVSIPRWFD